MRRLLIPSLVATLCAVGTVMTADALVTTSNEELETFIEDVTAPRAEQRLDAALSYVNLSEIPCRLNNDGRLTEYGEEGGRALPEALRSALNVFDSERQQALQTAVNTREDHATVTTRIGDDEYEQTVIYELVRHDARWLVRAVRTL